MFYFFRIQSIWVSIKKSCILNFFMLSLYCVSCSGPCPFSFICLCLHSCRVLLLLVGVHVFFRLYALLYILYFITFGIIWCGLFFFVVLHIGSIQEWLKMLIWFLIMGDNGFENHNWYTIKNCFTFGELTKLTCCLTLMYVENLKKN